MTLHIFALYVFLVCIDQTYEPRETTKPLGDRNDTRIQPSYVGRN